MTIAQDKLLKLVNAQNVASLPSALTLAQVTVGTAGTNANVKHPGKDTVTRIDAILGVKYKGFVSVYYNRFDLATVFKNVNPIVGLDVQEGQSTNDLIPLVNAKYGTDFEIGDFEVLPLATGDSERTVTMTAVNGNVAYKGSFVLRYDLSATELDSVVLDLDLAGFNYLSADITKGQANIYSYNVDGSNVVGDFWATAALGVVDETFVQAFNQSFRIDEEWVFDGVQAADYNLGGAEVVYTGSVDNNSVMAAIVDPVLLNPGYRNVCIIKLSDTLCSNFAGYLTVYYGGQAV